MMIKEMRAYIFPPRSCELRETMAAPTQTMTKISAAESLSNLMESDHRSRFDYRAKNRQKNNGPHRSPDVSLTANRPGLTISQRLIRPSSRDQYVKQLNSNSPQIPPLSTVKKVFGRSILENIRISRIIYLMMIFLHHSPESARLVRRASYRSWQARVQRG